MALLPGTEWHWQSPSPSAPGFLPLRRARPWQWPLRQFYAAFLLFSE